MKFKILLIACVSSLIIFCNRDKSDACTDPGPNLDVYNLFVQESINPVGLEPFYFTFHAFYRDGFDSDSIKNNDNLDAWAKSFNIENKIKNSKIEYYWYGSDTAAAINERIKSFKNGLSYLIYKATPEELIEVKKRALGQKNKIQGDYTLRESIDLLDKNEIPAIIDYLLFAKEIDKTLNGDSFQDRIKNQSSLISNPWENVSRDSLKLLKLMDKGLKSLKTINTSPDYLKSRYVYQIVRLAHYNNLYKKCAEYFDQLFPASEIGGLMYYWALGHKAGALKALNKETEADYLYVQIFANCRSKRVSAYQSAKITDQNEWNSVYAKCKTIKEKTTLFAMRGINFQNDATVEMREIMKLDANSEYLELLAGREIVKLENAVSNVKIVPLVNYFDDSTRRYKKLNETNFDKVRAIVKEQLNDKRVVKKSMWNIADAYMDFIAGDYKSAQSKLLALDGASDLNETQRKQLHIFDCAMAVASVDNITPIFEDEIYSKLYFIFEPSKISRSNEDEIVFYDETDQFECGYRYVMDNMSLKYFKQGDKLKALLTSPGFRCVNTINDAEIAKEMIKLIEKPEKTNFEEYLLSKFSNEAKDIKSELYDVIGTIYLRDENYSGAVSYLSKVRPLYAKIAENYKLKADPFQNYYEGRYTFDFAKYSKEKYNKLSFATKCLELSEIANDKDPAKAAPALVKLANARYNVSYWGPCRNAIDFYCSTTYFPDRDGMESYLIYDYLIDKQYSDFVNISNKDYFSVDKADTYYKKALALAQDKELKAACIFGMAKCEQIKFYTTEKVGFEAYDYLEGEQRDNFLQTKSKYRSSFDKLIAEYKDTKVFSEAKSNCSYFAKYAARKK